MIGPIAFTLLIAGQASLDEDARCVTDQLTQAERTQIAAAAQQDADLPPALSSRLEEVGAGCAERRGWTADSAGQIGGFAIATILRDETAPRLLQAGINTAMVDAWLALEDDPGGAASPITDELAERLVNDLHQAGVPMSTLEANGELLGAYVAARMMMQRVERGLPL
ncbi:MAG: hypothetical protein M3177_03095 [Pseudomonadota bacterium]|nr:hypothetical protein [Pseudomonadota bacterium]